MRDLDTRAMFLLSMSLKSPFMYSVKLTGVKLVPPPPTLNIAFHSTLPQLSILKERRTLTMSRES